MAAKTSIAKTITKLYYSSGSHSSHPKHLAPFSLSSSFSSSSPNAASPAAESQSTIYSQAPGRERSRLSRWLLFLPGAITFGLGTWADYQKAREEEVGIGTFKCKGYFDEKGSIYVGTRSRSISGVTENGYYIVTPLIPVPDKDERISHQIVLTVSGSNVASYEEIDAPEY